MTSKQRAYLKSIAMTTEPILQIGKSSLTPEFTQSAKEALEARELIKISVLQKLYGRSQKKSPVFWLNGPVPRLFRLSVRKSFFIKKGKKEKKKIQLP